MVKNFIGVVILIVVTSVMAHAFDLYKVKIPDESAASKLRATGVQAILRLTDGFLVLTDENSGPKVIQSDLTISLLASGISPNDLVYDTRLDRNSDVQYPLVYQDGDLRLYIKHTAESPIVDDLSGFCPLRGSDIEIKYLKSTYDPETLLSRLRAKGVQLDTMITKISQDSLYSYVLKLQTWGPRLVGSTAGNNARDWFVSKFQSFGYDSVIIDSFIGLQGTFKPCQNVIAVKVGTRFPHHQIVVGAHQDSYAGVGADDNASGTAAVLEMARVLVNTETDMSIAFVIFNGEETGDWGSYHFVEDIPTHSDTIMYMVNLDMIGYRENTTQANIHHGPQAGFPNLWIKLADSLVGITGVLSGLGSSDNLPFVQAGIEDVYVEEYIFSTVWHDVHDSIAYISFPYMTNMVKATLATIYTAGVTAWPAKSLSFTFPQGEPHYFPPDMPASFMVSIEPTYGGSLVAGSEKIFYSLGWSPFAKQTLTMLSPGLYLATIPASSCGVRCKFYLAANESSVGTVYSISPEKPHRAAIASTSSIILDDNFETDAGWISGGSATRGNWERAVPSQGYVIGSPLTDFDGSGSCYVTGNAPGNSYVYGGNASLTSPSFIAMGTDIRIDFAAWFSTCRGINYPDDVLGLYATNDGGTSWVLLQAIGPTKNVTGGWYQYHINLSQFMQPIGTIKFKFDVSDQGEFSRVEAAIDAFKITEYTCGACCSGVRGNVDVTGDIDIADLRVLVAYLTGSGPTPPCMEETDIDASSSIDISDLSTLVDYLTGGSFVLPNCP
jgi:aminopeptidase YwaD